MTTSASDSGPSRPPFPPAADELPNLSQPQRPSLRLSLPATPSAARHSSTAASSTHLPSDNPRLAGAAAPPRASSHSRSQSMSEAHPPSPPLHGTAHPDLVRRHHTLSTSASSRLIRQERRSARVALQGVGLSAEDVKYYVGSSPVDRRSGWSDAGHDASLGGGGGSYGLHSSPSSSTFDSSPVPPARRSSFQVLRGARGEATLTERRQSANFEDLSRTTPPRPGQERRTSLQPFLEGELAMESEADTIGREQYASRSYTSRYSPPASAFPRSGSPYSLQQTIGSVVSPGGGGPWQADEEERAAVRRRQSLNNFRAEELASSVRSEGWMGHERLGSEDLVGSGSFAHSRSGTSPALSISTNIARPLLSHSNSIISPGGSRTLGHSKSLSSHTAPGGPLSPVGGFPRSPWSPTVEETKQLGMGGEPVRGGNGGRLGEGVSRLSVDMSALALATDVVDDGRSEVDFTRDTVVPPKRRLPPLMTNPDVLASLGQPSQPIGAAPSSFLSRQGPASAAAYVLPLGHSHLPFSSKPRPESYSNAYSPQPLPSTSGVQTRGNLTAAPGAGGSDWLRQKELLIGATSFPSTLPRANPPSAHDWDNGEGVDQFAVDLAMHQQQQIQLLQLQMNHAMQAMDLMKAQGVPSPQYPEVRSASVEAGSVPVVHEVEEAPVDLAALIAEKGYNPTSFNLRPVNARFFVIKSYTEEDVHKSLKHEIWASTDLGNKRLDRAFRESAEKGPIYLFFSVNASGHFAGMAQMLTPVDYATSSTVWASDKWKGVLKLKWIYIKDVPLASLRHIRLSNTPENKPVTSSRDTQEVPYEAGCEVLRILSSYQSRTSLLEVSNRQEGLQQRASTPSHYAVRPTSAPPTQYQYQQQQPMLYPQQQQQLLHHHQQQQLIHQSQQLQQHQQQQQQQQHQQAMFNQFQPPQGGRRYGPSGGGLMRAQDGGVF